MAGSQQPPLSSWRGRAANGRQCYEIFRASPRLIIKAGEILHDRFGFDPIVKPVIGADSVITACTKGDLTLHLGWDNWSGFYVLAGSLAGDGAVDEFGDYLDSIFNDP